MHSPGPGGRPLLTSGVVLWNVLSGPAWVLTSAPGVASSEVGSSSSLVIAGVTLTRHALARVTSIHPRSAHSLAPSHHVLLLLLCLLLLPLGLGHVAGVASLLLARVAAPRHHAGVTRLSPPTRGVAGGATRGAIARGVLARLRLSVVSGVVLLARKLVMLGMVVGTRGLLLLLLMLLLLLLLVFTTAPKQLQVLTSGGLAAVVCHLICR